MQKGFRSTPWQKAAPWYNRITGHGQGHYYHQHVIIPKVLNLLELNSKVKNNNIKLLDLACGNGVLAKAIPEGVAYLGVDNAPSLISEAKRTDRNQKHKYLVADITKLLTIPQDFTHTTIILAIQNIENSIKVMQNASQHLVKKGILVMVLNHPAFRIPRQSSWGIDDARKIQYRRVDKYLSPMQIPINMNPSDRNSPITMSYHNSLSAYSKMLKDAGFIIDLIEEWASDRESEGSAARMENRSRSEIPLFLAVKAVKK